MCDELVVYAFYLYVIFLYIKILFSAILKISEYFINEENEAHGIIQRKQTKKEEKETH